MPFLSSLRVSKIDCKASIACPEITKLAASGTAIPAGKTWVV